MNGFSVRVLTTHGQALVASATAGNRLQFSGMRVSSSAMTEPQAAAAVVTDFSVDAGAIKSASASGSVCRIVATYQNPANTEAHLKSFALCGRLESELNDNVVAVQSDADADVVLSPYGTPGDTVLISFSFNVSAGGSVLVEVTGAASATLADLDRFVSCHKAGDPLEGEDQEIWGKKSFRGAINPVQGLSWPAMPISGSDILVESQLTGFTGGGTQEVHHIFRMTDQTHSVVHGLKCVFDGPTEKMTLSSDVDRVELPTLALAPDYDNGTIVSVGQILLIHVENVGSSTTAIFTGNTLSGGTFFSVHSVSSSSAGFAAGSTDLSSHTFRLMNDGQLSPGDSAVFFAQCIA